MKTLLLLKIFIKESFHSLIELFNPKNEDFRNTVFLMISMIFAWFAGHFFDYDSFIFFFTAGIFVYTFISLYWIATVQIDSFRVCLGWSFINASVFYATASLLIKENEVGKSYVLSLFIGFFIIALLYRFSSYISYLLKLNNEKEDYSMWRNGKTKFNNCWFLIVLCIVSSVTVLETESWAIKKYIEQKEYKQAVWINIKDWHTEIIDGNTIYIINCSKGSVGIYPTHHPKIRNINSHTQIKLIGKPYQRYGLKFFDRLEIKN